MRLLVLSIISALLLTGCGGQETLIDNGAGTVCAVHETSSASPYPLSCFGRYLDDFSSPLQYETTDGKKTYYEGAETYLTNLTDSYISDIAATNSRVCVITHKDGKKSAPGQIQCYQTPSSKVSLPDITSIAGDTDFEQLVMINGGVCASTDTDVNCFANSTSFSLSNLSGILFANINKIDTYHDTLCVLHGNDLDCFDVDFDNASGLHTIISKTPISVEVEDYVKMQLDWRYCWVTTDGIAGCDFKAAFNEHAGKYKRIYAPKHEEYGCAEVSRGIISCAGPYSDPLIPDNNELFVEQYKITNLKFIKDYAFCGVASTGKVICRQSARYEEFRDIPAHIGNAIIYP
mgnify:FL=1